MSIYRSLPDELALAEAVRTCQDNLERVGYGNLVNVPENFDHLAFTQRFGELVPQYDGNVVWSIKADPRFADTYHSLNNRPLYPHTECNEFDSVPPRYLALWCVKPADCGGGQTTLADGYRFIATLDQSEREMLASRVYEFRSSPGLEESGVGLRAYHPIYDLSVDPGTPIVRFSFYNMQDGGDPFIVNMRRRFVDYFDATCERIVYKKNSFLIWDNWRMLHARTAFQDLSRHLKRVWLAPTIPVMSR